MGAGATGKGRCTLANGILGRKPNEQRGVLFIIVVVIMVSCLTKKKYNAYMPDPILSTLRVEFILFVCNPLR